MKDNGKKQMERDCVRQMWPAFALHFVQEVLSLTVPLVTSWMIGDMADALLSLDLGRIRGRLAIFLAAFALDVFVQPLFLLWRNLVLTKRGFGYCGQMFCRYLHLPMKKARELDTAALVERMDTDTTDYYFLLMEKWTRPFTFLIYLAFLTAMLVTRRFHPLFILVMLVLAALPVVRAAVNGRRKAALHQAGRDYEEERENMEYGMFGARDFLNGFRIGGRYIGRLHKKFEEYTKETAAAQDAMDAADTMFSYLCACGVPLGVIAAGSLLILSGKMGIGALLSGYLVMPTLTNFYEAFEERILNARKEAVVRLRLAVFYAGRDGRKEAVSPRKICLKDVSFAYPNAKEAVFVGLSLDMKLGCDSKERAAGDAGKNQTVLHTNKKAQGTVRIKQAEKPQAKHLRIAGENGSGKSTLLALLAGIYEPDAGRITDESGRELGCGSLRGLVSLQEQDGGLFSATVAENLFVEEDQLAEAEQILRAMGFEKPMDEMLEEEGSNLSPGERKKLLLVRALLKPAPVLALDEPLNHLDAEGSRVLTELLEKEERPVLLVSHTPVEGGLWEEVLLP